MKAARKAWNFSGYVTSDSDSIADAYASHHYVSSAAGASCGGVKDGQCDIDSGEKTTPIKTITCLSPDKN